MHVKVKDYVAREFGAWSVLAVSVLIGIAVSGVYSWRVIAILLGLILMVNSRQALIIFSYNRKDYQSLAIFLLQAAGAAIIFILIFGSDILTLIPLLVFPIAYVLARWFTGEHFIVTQLLGFVCLSLAAVIVKFLFTGGIDIRLFLAVSFYFMAGVVKVRALLQDNISNRLYSVLYLLFTVFVFRRMHIPTIILLPLLDNLSNAILPFKASLQTIGWIEVGKSLVVLILFAVYY